MKSKRIVHFIAAKTMYRTYLGILITSATSVSEIFMLWASAEAVIFPVIASASYKLKYKLT